MQKEIYAIRKDPFRTGQTYVSFLCAPPTVNTHNYLHRFSTRPLYREYLQLCSPLLGQNVGFCLFLHIMQKNILFVPKKDLPFGIMKNKKYTKGKEDIPRKADNEGD